jgi:soluble lytic murein transglycosylase
MQLGAAHLDELLARWNGSYVLTIASYNAGSANVANWIAVNGDPRSPNIDIIDWIELIPFGETRNYVQRVVENIQVYRTRLSGNGQPLMILADLSRSNAPSGPVPLPRPAPDR